MRGTRVHALRTEERPHPGRKNGGTATVKEKQPKLAFFHFDHKAERRSRKWYVSPFAEEIMEKMATFRKKLSDKERAARKADDAEG